MLQAVISCRSVLRRARTKGSSHNHLLFSHSSSRVGCIGNSYDPVHLFLSYKHILDIENGLAVRSLTHSQMVDLVAVCTYYKQGDHGRGD